MHDDAFFLNHSIHSHPCAYIRDIHDESIGLDTVQNGMHMIDTAPEYFRRMISTCVSSLIH